MALAKWLPFSVRKGGPAARAMYEALVSDPPAGLMRAIADYLAHMLVVRGYGYGRGVGLNRDRVLAVEQALGVDLHSQNDDDDDHLLAGVFRLPLDGVLSVIDYCVHHFTVGSPEAWHAVRELKAAMERSRFAYTIDDDSRAVVEVLPPGVTETVERAFGVKAAESEMREAVHWATGVKPDPLKSFDAMVRALEAVVIPALSPKDAKATLGKVLGSIRTGQVKLDTALPRSAQAPAGALPVVDLVRGMLELVWSGYERHATGGAPPTPDEARALIGVTGTLVSWFGGGMVKKA